MHIIVNSIPSECNKITKPVRFLHGKISLLICTEQIEWRLLPCDWALSQSKAAMDLLQTPCQTAGIVQMGALETLNILSLHWEPVLLWRKKGISPKGANFNLNKQTAHHGTKLSQQGEQSSSPCSYKHFRAWKKQRKCIIYWFIAICL